MSSRSLSAPIRLRRRPRLGGWSLAVVWLTLAPAAPSAQLPGSTQPPPPPPAAPGSAGPAREAVDLSSNVKVALQSAPATQAAIDGSTAYVPLKDGRLVAVDLETGTIRWSLGYATTIPPVAGGGLVYAAGAEVLTAFLPDSSVKWRLPMPGGFSAPPAWAGGWLLVGAASGDVLCLRASDGHVLWTRRVTSPLRAGAAISADRVYLSLEDGRVAAYNLTTGEPIWERKLGGTPGAILALDDRLFVGSRDKFFYCLKTSDGDQRWRWRTGGAISGLPVVDDKRVYFTSFDNVLRALDRNGGSQRWKTGLPLRPSGGPLIIGESVVVAGVSAEVRLYHVEDGKETGHFEAPTELAAAPQLLPGPVPALSAVLLLTRSGELQLLRRRLEPSLVPLDYPLGAPVPLDAPPPAAPTP